MENGRPRLLIADGKGNIFDLPHLETVGMKGSHLFRLLPKELVKLPRGSELFLLPHRIPAGYDPDEGRFVTVATNPLSRRSQRAFAVAAFLPPGYTVSYTSAYREVARPRMLPLFAYAACALYKGEFYAGAVRVDRDIRHDPRFIDMDRVRRNAVKLKSSFPHNRLIGHLKTCALAYGCPNAQNFFLSRYEAPLPVSPSCNARCSGCISYQVRTRCPAAQPRIAFVPRPHEIAEVALFHIENVRDPVVSFGQGCEGEPLLEALTVERAIRLVRRKTSKGTIHMNTNASRPKDMGRLFDAGLSSIRVSLNSVRDEHYMRYYKPRAYAFRDVVSSIKIAKKRGAFVSVNYLTMPGFTDSRDEFNALKIFIEAHRIDMIQWRNLNFDPLRYFRMLKVRIDRPDMIGIREVIGLLTREFPDLMMGYFNPSRLGMGRHRR